MVSLPFSFQCIAKITIRMMHNQEVKPFHILPIGTSRDQTFIRRVIVEKYHPYDTRIIIGNGDVCVVNHLRVKRAIAKDKRTPRKIPK